MRFIKFLLIISILYLIFCLIKPINDSYAYFVGLVIGVVGEYYWLKKSY